VVLVRLARTTLVSGVKLGIFSVVALLTTGVLVAIMGNFGGGPTNSYTAIFTNASMLLEGDDVRVAGVVLGKVKKVDVHEGDQAEVEFTVAEDLPITTESRVEIRYLNLVGDRYLTVTEGGSGGSPLRDGATIGTDRTTPALNLTALYNGFAPLFNALEPEQVNELSLNLVKVLQGEGGTIESLMQHTASLTSAIADRDELVGDVIANMDELLGTVDGRQQQLTKLIRELRRWVGGLAEDRVQIGRSVANISDMTGVLADLLTDARPLVKADIAQLRRLSEALSRPATKKVVIQVLRDLPEMLEDQTRTGTYGSWYNYYVCAAQVDIRLPEQLDIPGIENLRRELRSFSFSSDAKRCQQ
jgi:phospholipid/cholesterol/gamma-HCH transport system substrate-binding protein